MKATFTEEQRALAETARDLGAGGLAAARVMLDGGEPDDSLTAALFGGFAGVGVAEAAGGAGGGLVEVAILLEGLGRTVTPTPFVHHILALQVAHAAGHDVGAALAPDARWVLTPGGQTTAVPDGPTATAAVSVGDDHAVTVHRVEAASPRPGLDPTRPLADLRLGEVVAAARTGSPHAGLRAAAALAAEQVGVGRGAVDLAVEYAKTREQFGQPVGRFQAVAHQLADAFTGLELAWSLVLYACWALDAGAPDAAGAVHRAAAKAGEAAVFACERAMQVHGGIGITWEADPHLFLRRAIADDAWLGSARRHRQQAGAALLHRA